MIKKLIAKNFQQHKNKSIIFGPHVTFIIGDNNAGKSTLFRAIRWATLNKRPRGRLIRFGAKSVTAILKWNRKIIKRISGRSNIYKLGTKRFAAVATSVPPAIADFLKLDELNFQQQKDQFFWFDKTPGQVAKELNKIVDLEAIDRIQAGAAKILRERKAELAVCKKRLQQAESDIKALSWVPRLDVKLGKIEKMGEYRLKSHILPRIRDAIGGCVVADTIAKACGNGAAVGAAVGAVFRRTNGAAVGAAAIAKLCQNVTAAEQIGNMTVPNIPDKPTGEHEKLLTVLKSLTQQEECICQLDQKIKSKRNNLEKKLGGRCPLCGNILSDRSLI